MTGWRLVMLMLIILAVGCILFRIWKFFTERTVSGTVVRAGLAHTYTAGEDPDGMTSANYDFRLKIALLIHTAVTIRISTKQPDGMPHKSITTMYLP